MFAGVHRLQRLSPFSDLCERQLYVSFVPYAGELYAVCVSAGSKDIRPRLAVGTLSGSKWTPVAYTDCVDPRNVVGFTFNNKLYIVAADAGLPNGAELQFFDKDTRKIYIDHTINSASPTSVAFWQMKSNGEFNLALANSGSGHVHFHLQLESHVLRQRFSRDTAKVSTVIYKYDLSRNAWKTLQQIPTYAATDAEFFTLGPDSSTKEFFLAIANQYEQHDDHRNYAVNSVVYKYVDGKFVPFQCLHTTGATKIAAYEGAGGEFLLAVGSLYEPVHLYQYNGWHFVLAEVQYTQSTMGPGVHDFDLPPPAAITGPASGCDSRSRFFVCPLFRHFALSSAASRTHVLYLTPSTEGPGAYKVDFYHDNQIQRWYDDSLRWCHESSRLATEESAQRLVSQLDQVYYVDKHETIRIPGEVVFQDLHVQEAIRAQQFEELASGESYSMKDLEELEKLQTELNTMKDNLRGMLTELNDALKLTGDQVLIGDYHFNDIALDCPTQGCKLGQLEALYVNKEDVSNLPSRLFFTNAPQFPNAAMSFESLSVQNLQVDGLVNGLNVSTLVTVSGNHVLSGNIRFSRPIHALSDVVTNSLSGVFFSPHHLLLTEGDQVQSAELTMTDATANVLHVAASCNGISLDKFYRNALTLDGNHVITGRKIVRDLAVEGILQISDLGLFNNVNLPDLWRSVMWIYGHQAVAATHEYTNVQFSDISVRGAVNGLQIPGPDVVLVNQNVTITAEKVFLADCLARELHVNIALNGIRHIPDPSSDWKGQLDMLVKTPTQRAEFLRRRRTTVMNGTWTFKGKVVFEDRVTVTGLINDRKLDDLYRYALRLDTPVFPNFKKVRNLSSPDINGLHMPSSFILRHGPKVMHGEKVFAKLRLAGEVVVKGLLNGVNLGVWKDSLLTRGNQVVRAPKVFMRNLHVKNLVVEESINGVQPFRTFCHLE
ncbi:hypothetical protein MRX96_022778 [Rhipicephalus microplus]